MQWQIQFKIWLYNFKKHRFGAWGSIHGCRIVRIDESTELWWPQGVIKLIVSTKYSDEGEERFHLFDGLLQSLTNADFKK